MATQNPIHYDSAPAGSDLSAQQFKFVNLDASAELVLAAAGGTSIGVLQDKPDAQGARGAVMTAGRSKIQLADTLAPGTEVASDAAGAAVAAASGDRVLGTLWEGGDAGEVGSVQLTLNGGQLN